MTLVERLNGSRHGPFFLAAGLAALALLIGVATSPLLSFVVAGCVFFAVYLALTFLRLPALTPDYLKRFAADADEPAPVILVVTFAAVIVCIVSLFSALNGANTHGVFGLALAFLAVSLGWLTIHTMAAFHYAHLYWRPEDGEGDGVRGGLDFPGATEPGGHDFLYFSLVIGMTAQTSDIAITSTAMRRINLLHAVVSFFFNTVLVAAAVNAAVTLAQ